MAAYSLAQRARQLSRASPLHGQVLAFVNGDAARAALLRAAAAGEAPVGAISHDLVEQFGRESFASTATRQFVGVAVAACLESEGYAAAPKRVRLKGDPIFETGAVFLKESLSPPSSAQDLLARFVASLTDTEAQALADLLAHRLEQAGRARRTFGAE